MLKEVTEFLNGKIYESGEIEVSEIRLHDEVVKMCESNRCGNYNNSWTCPPAVGILKELSEKIRKYKKAYVFTTKHDLEDSFDFEGMTEGGSKHNKLTRELHLKFGKDMPVLGAGGCRLCEKCNYPEPCRNPESIFPSVEACGMLVTELAATAGIKYYNGENTVTYFGMILFNE